MFLHIGIVTVWILITIAFYIAVGRACSQLRPSPVMVAVYASARRSIEKYHGALWYVFLFVFTLIAATVGLYGGLLLSGMDEVWRVAVAVVTCLSVGYSINLFWPKPEELDRKDEELWRLSGILAAAAGAAVYLLALVRWPNWITMDIGTLALSVPPMVWLRALRIRTATCMLFAATLYDAIHVFGTGWMAEFIHNLAHTPFMMQIPSELSLETSPLTTFGHGDIVAPGLLMIVATRLADRRHQWRLVFGTSLGIALGFAIATSIAIAHGLPALVVLVPCSCAGYLAGHLYSKRGS